MSLGGEIALLAPTILLLAGIDTVVLGSRSAYNQPTPGNVGCILSSSELCEEDEYCFDDLVLGRCISASSNTQHLRLGPLSGPPLGLLGAEMRRVFGLGLSWRDVYTQCVFQTLLHHFQYKLPYSTEECSYLLEAQQQDGESLSYLRPETQQVEDGEGLSYLSYLPDTDSRQAAPLDLEALRYRHEDEDVMSGRSFGRSDSEWAFYPQDSYNNNNNNNFHNMELMLLNSGDPEEVYHQNNNMNNMFDEDGEEEEEKILAMDPEERQALLSDIQKLLGSYSDNRQIKDLDSDEEELEEGLVDDDGYLSPDQLLDEEALSTDTDDLSEPGPYLPNMEGIYHPYPGPGYLPYPDAGYMPYQELPEVLPRFPDHSQTEFQQLKDFAEQYADSDRPFVRRQRNADFLVAEATPVNYDNNNNEWGSAVAATTIGDRDENLAAAAAYDFDYNDPGVLEEGDNEDTVFYSVDGGSGGPYGDLNLPPFVTVFDRKERLDVKKPGPFFSNSQNNFFLDKLRDRENAELADYDEIGHGQTEYEMALSPQAHKEKKDLANEVIGEVRDEEQTNNGYLTITLGNRLKNLGQANSLINFIAELTQVPEQSFGTPKLAVSVIKVKVESNPLQLNASLMASRLTDQIEKVQERASQIGLQVDQISATDEDGVVSTYTGDSNLFLSLYLLAAGVGSLLLLAVFLFLLKRRRSNQKTIETKKEKEEPVNEYKQLVRDWSRSSRTSSSGGGSHQPPPTTATLAEEKGGISQSPASTHAGKTSGNGEDQKANNSTAWSEEPNVSAMDISTGHMVLNYMEDHLKNKQRLEQEWVGLCAYEAEPAATSVAFQVENKKKNRYPDKLPYDHNRVLLNALVNGSNSDYINASTVTDHDPRNPAYIVTQGPMAHTVADFWQMVWEQGSVVIVMLSRLAENGYQLAHRYWPEEGSEQYHIYEVHLVSEHVWCDDYLVRSLYLKNTQTNETRTVTQFHFLSWADSAVPVATKSLLEFRRKVNKSYRGRSCPIIVHCSDGVGRSGTYILIDMVLNRITQGSKEIDIAATLEHIRDQRSGMVQTRSQFEFCLTAVAEETHAILKTLATQ